MKLQDVLREQGPYKLISNNCQTYCLGVAYMFGLDNKVIFTKCTDFNGKFGCYTQKPKFISEQYTDIDGNTSTNNGEVVCDSDQSSYSD
jgi:hypothetical protein